MELSDQNFGNSNQPVMVRNMQLGDVEKVAALHSLVFPDYFLTHMGLSFLKRFYYQFAQQPGVAFVAFCGIECVGFVIGTSQSNRLFGDFYRKNFLPIILISFKQLLIDSFIRKEFYKRAGHIRLALTSISSNKREVASQTMEKPVKNLTAELYGIGVHPSYRGKGIADALILQFCNNLSEDGVKTVYLTVRSDNFRAIHFYEKTGWKMSGIANNSLSFSRSTDL